MLNYRYCDSYQWRCCVISCLCSRLCLFNKGMGCTDKSVILFHRVPDANRTRWSSNSVFSVIMWLSPSHSSVASGEHAMWIANFNSSCKMSADSVENAEAAGKQYEIPQASLAGYTSTGCLTHFYLILFSYPVMLQNLTRFLERKLGLWSVDGGSDFKSKSKNTSLKKQTLALWPFPELSRGYSQDELTFPTISQASLPLSATWNRKPIA